MEEASLNLIFFNTCIPKFFKTEIYNILSTFTELKHAESELYHIFDTIFKIIALHDISPSSIISETVKDFLLENFKHLSSVWFIQIQLQQQLIFHFELLRIQEFQDDKSFTARIGELCRALCMRLAIEQDSTAFYKYFLTEILPRYSPLLNSSVLLRIAELFELQNEVEEYLSKIIIVKPSPDKLTTQVNETQNKTRTSPIRKSERISNLVLKNQYKRIQPDRNLQRNISLKKQVKMKKIKSKTPHTPDRGLSGISNCAKRLKEINQTHFYDKKGNQIDDNKEEIEPEDLQVILAVNTPTKETKITQYEPKTYKNLFALYE